MKKAFSLRNFILAASLLLQPGTLCIHSHAAAGDVDLSFDPGSGVNGTVNAVVVQSDGKVIIGGQFTTVKGLTRTNLARLNADGTGDATFIPSVALPYLSISSLALQPDGNLLIAGQAFDYTVCDQYGCYEDYSSVVLRLNAAGSQDIDFIPAVGGAGADYGLSSSLALQPDGKVLVAGYFTDFNGTNRRGLVRLGTNGVLDASFDPGAGFGGFVGGIRSVTSQADGKILISGDFTYHLGLTNRSGLARLNADGGLDSSFHSDFGVRQYRDCGGDVCYTVAVPTVAMVQADGKMLVGYSREHWQCDPFEGGCLLSYTHGVTRLNANGTSDQGFIFTNVVNNTVLLGSVSSIAVQADGKIVVGSDAFNTVRLARLNTDGSWDSSFSLGTGPNQAVNAVVLQPDGRVLIGGQFTTVNGTNGNHIARLNTDGSLDLIFGSAPGLDRAVSQLALQPDGKLLIGEGLAFINGTNRYGSYRLDADGRVDDTFVSSSFNPDLAGLIPNDDCPTGFPDPCVTRIVPESAAVQSDGKVLMGGYVLTTESYFDGDILYFRYFVARFHGDGSRDTTFGPAVGDRVYWEKQTVRTIAVQPDGEVLIGGAFYSIHGTNRFGIARLNANGGLDASFVPGTTTPYGPNAVALQPDGKVLLGGGSFSTNGLSQGSGIVRLNSDGSLDGSFAAGMVASWVSSIALQPDGKVLIGGSFTTINGTTRNRIARLNANGSLDLGFDPGTGADGVVRTIALQPDGNILIGGDFTTINGVVRPHVARLFGDAAAPSPSLTLTRSNEAAVLSWPSSTLNLQLQQSTNLALPNVWSAVAQPRVTNGAQISVTVPTTAEQKFFRLRNE